MKGGRNQEGYADPTATIAVGRLALKKGFVVVGLPCIDPKESDPMRITINGYRYRAVPIYTEES